MKIEFLSLHFFRKIELFVAHPQTQIDVKLACDVARKPVELEHACC